MAETVKKEKEKDRENEERDASSCALTETKESSGSSVFSNQPPASLENHALHSSHWEPGSTPVALHHVQPHLARFHGAH